MALAGSARCPKHPEAVAVDVCQRCGRFVCGDCTRICAEDAFCTDCAGIFDRPSPMRPKVAFALAMAPAPPLVLLAIVFRGLASPLSLGLGLPLVAAALALTLQERSARRRGEAVQGVFYLLTWVMIAIDLAGTAALVVSLRPWGL